MLVLLCPTRIRTVKELWDRAYGFSSLFERTNVTTKAAHSPQTLQDSECWSCWCLDPWPPTQQTGTYPIIYWANRPRQWYFSGLSPKTSLAQMKLPGTIRSQMVYSVASRINKAHKPLQHVNAGSCLVYNIVSHKLISSGCKLCYTISQILRNKLVFLPWSLLFFCRTCLLSPEMFSKADPHKQLFQLLLAIQGLGKNLLYETMTQMAWESADILWCHLWFTSKLSQRNKCRNFILMMHHYPDLGSASD